MIFPENRYPLFGIMLFGCGCSLGVEHDLAKVGVEGSNPFARSNFQMSGPDTWVTERT